MTAGRVLLAVLTLAAMTAAAATPLTESVAWERRGLKTTAGKLHLRSSLSRAVRDKLRGVIKTSRRPEERQLIDLIGQSQTVRAAALAPDLAGCRAQPAMRLLTFNLLDRPGTIRAAGSRHSVP